MAKMPARESWFEATKPVDQYPEVSLQRCPKWGTTWQIMSRKTLRSAQQVASSPELM